VHGGRSGPLPGVMLPQGLLIEALNWRNGGAINVDEYLEALATINGFVYLEFGQNREYHKAQLDNIQLHPLVGHLLFWEIYGYDERVLAAVCLVRAAMTYTGRPEVMRTHDRHSLQTDLAAINAGTLNTIAALLLDPQSRSHFGQIDSDQRQEIELWFCFHANLCRQDDGSLPRHLEAALSHVDSAIASLTGASLIDRYHKLHRRHIFGSLTKDE
jgi:hypothetical protein